MTGLAYSTKLTGAIYFEGNLPEQEYEAIKSRAGISKVRIYVGPDLAESFIVERLREPKHREAVRRGAGPYRTRPLRVATGEAATRAWQPGLSARPIGSGNFFWLLFPRRPG